MNLDEFKKSLSEPTPPNGIHFVVEALWWAGKGDWNRAHNLVQDESGGAGAWVHAYLHREEGDNWNANYWYRRAGKKMPELELSQEWESIVEALI